MHLVNGININFRDTVYDEYCSWGFALDEWKVFFSKSYKTKIQTYLC